MILIGLLATWLSSRGKFMLLDGIVKNEAQSKNRGQNIKLRETVCFYFPL